MAFYASKLVKEVPKKKKFPILTILLSIIVLGVIGAYIALTMTPLKEKVALYSCYWNYSTATALTGPEGKSNPITIESGDTILGIGQKLEKQQIISRASDFYCYVKKINAGDKLQAGYYEINTPITIEQLVPYLQEAHIPTIRISIPEGLRMDEIATRLDSFFGGTENSIRKFNKDEFTALLTDKSLIDANPYTKGKSSFEGFLFPDTYEVQKNATAQEVFTLLTDTFKKKTDNTMLAQSTTLTPYQVVVLASILEKESGRSYEEKQVIAGILLKRLRSGWLLEVDATFLYEKKNWTAPITVADKAANTPYNTYIRQGLPPTPICNPGIDSIQAVLSPKESDYWFYLHGLDGKVRYGKNYAEHLNNIELYLR